jgi:hypothetical protein
MKAAWRATPFGPASSHVLPGMTDRLIREVANEPAALDEQDIAADRVVRSMRVELQPLEDRSSIGSPKSLGRSASRDWQPASGTRPRTACRRTAARR